MTKLEAYLKALGYFGGTIHQVSEETGVGINDLLEGNPSATVLDSDYSHGWFAGRTCTVQFNRARNFPNYKGNRDFWLGVRDGLRQV